MAEQVQRQKVRIVGVDVPMVDLVILALKAWVAGLIASAIVGLAVGIVGGLVAMVLAAGGIALFAG